MDIMGSIKEHPWVWGIAGGIGFLLLIYWATSGNSAPAAAVGPTGPSDAAIQAGDALQAAQLQEQGNVAIATMQAHSADLQTTTAGTIAALQARYGYKTSLDTNATTLSADKLAASSANLANKLTTSTANLNIRSQAADLQASLAEKLGEARVFSGTQVHLAKTAASEQEAIAAGQQNTLQQQIFADFQTRENQIASHDFTTAQKTYRLQAGLQ